MEPDFNILQSMELDPDEVRKLILNHLLINCFPSTAKEFAEHINGTSSKKNKDQNKVQEQDDDLTNSQIFQSSTIRKRIVDLICDGNVSESLSIINSQYPTVLSTNLDVHFELQCQRFIELIRDKHISEAIQFAQSELAPFGLQDKKFLDPLQDTVALFAYDSPEYAPVGYLLTDSHREEVAQMVNKAILQSLHTVSNSPIEQLLKHLTICQEMLYRESKEKKSSRWRLKDFLQSNAYQSGLSETSQQEQEYVEQMQTEVPQ